MSKILGRKPEHVFLFETLYEMPHEIGIEVEVEGTNLPQRSFRSWWNYHHDGSLRAPGGRPARDGDGSTAEYVCKRPIAREDVRKALDYLVKQLGDANATATWSNRTSVHVHLNCVGMTFLQILNQACLYYIFEDILSEYCGPTRMGNLFCLRAMDAEYVLDVLKNNLKRDTMRFDNNIRYSSQNWLALQQKGSLEYRMLQGTIDPDEIERWVNILLCVRDASKGYDDPTQFISEVSFMGPVEFTRKVFGEYAQLFEGFQNFERRIFEGVRLIQDIAYQTDWSVAQPKKEGLNDWIPFTDLVPATNTIGIPAWARAPQTQRRAPRIAVPELEEDM